MYIFSKRWIKLLFILPTLIFFTCYTLYPLIDALKTGFQHKPLFKPGVFVGLDNYVAIFHDENFIHSLKNTLIITVGQLILMLPLGLLLGLFLNRSFKGNAIVKLVSFAPNIVSGVMTGLVWLFILDPSIGVLNAFFHAVGLDALASKWIGGVTLTPYSIAVVDSWKGVGFYGVLFFAGLKMLPKETFEAATIDGATSVQRFIYLTIPLLKETIKITVVLIVINGINAFQTVYVLTGGGPNLKSHVLATYLYHIEFQRLDFGLGSAMATIMFILIMMLTLIFLNLTKRRVED